MECADFGGKIAKLSVRRHNCFKVKRQKIKLMKS